MAFVFKLERVDGTPAHPPEHHTVVPNWNVGDTIPLPARTLRVTLATRPCTCSAGRTCSSDDDRALCPCRAGGVPGCGEAVEERLFSGLP